MDAVASPVGPAPLAGARRPSGNLVEPILEHARLDAARPALVEPEGSALRSTSYGELAARIAAYAAAIRGCGLAPDARVLLLQRPDHEVYALALAVVASGRTLVLLDGRRGARALLSAIGDAAPDAVVAPASLLRWWPLVPALRRARRYRSPRALLGRRPAAPGSEGAAAFRPTRVGSATPAIVSFTSGTAGCAKVVVRTHGVLLAQHRALAAALPLDAGDVNLPGFPVATIHNLCCGTTTLLPPADLRAMADADPADVLALIERGGVTSLSGAPAFLARLAAAIRTRGAPVERVRRLAVGGGPVGRALCAELRLAFPAADAHVVYGASEAEPIATASIDEVLGAPDGQGCLVGRPVEGTELRLLDAERHGGGDGDVGEVAVRGAHVATDGAWHATGDVGRIDARGRLWLLGRVGDAVMHRGRPLHPFAAEAAALAIPGVRAAALVGWREVPEGELLVEPAAGADFPAVLAAARAALDARGLATLVVRPCRAIPMDARHGSKVSRAALLARLAREGR